uniref:Dynein heavy chain 1, axonemal n=1 Tax=Ciona savignyi TaxID=51511 RepID=H2YF90_CIOSA
MRMTEMVSGEGESVEFSEELYPTGNVEDWLGEVERVMLESVRAQCAKAVAAYPDNKRTEWVLQWPGQVVIAGAQVYWSQYVEEAITNGELDELYERLVGMLSDLVGLVRGKLTGLQRMMMSALIVIEVHARDVVGNLCIEKVKTINDFEWVSQLRYYWTKENMYVRAVNAEFPYGYEYLGNTGRLVITPLTDRCYLTLTGALHLKFGGAPAGPAGTGKTETTKDLGKALAIQTVVFNCSDQLDFMAMGKFFKGLASSGAWACFDEFNRIDIEVLSVVAQQIATIQNAQAARMDRFMFEGVEIALKASCAVFITMNPGYAGRTELPDNLKALFRPVAMMVPDYAMIAEISLYSFGFNNAKHLSKKIVSTFKLSSEQLSSQDHYDFGMRAVKTVISAAGNLKREHPDMDEEVICLRAIRDVNVPKFLLDDLKLFRGIVSDLFPKIKEEAIDYGALMDSIVDSFTHHPPGFVTKCIQLYETTVVRHGLMLVGPTCSGKTKCYNVLAKALTHYLHDHLSTDVLNPKSITMGQLYGEFDAMTHEWTDGILSTLIRQGCSATDQDKRWYMFDGPVDAVWIENMNTVLDDNKKLCLSSGEIIKLTAHMTMMFEVADLAVASPATVSRCGMVYLEPGYIGLAPFVYCWMKRVPDAILPFVDQLNELFNKFLESPCFVQDVNLSFTLFPCINLSSAVFPRINLMGELIEPWFFFALIWSVGGTVDNDGRLKFSNYLREKMKEENITLQFPEAGLVYDYQLDDAGITTKSKPGDWYVVSSNVVGFIHFINPTTAYADIIVPTIDTVRTSLLVEMLIMHKKQILTIGPTGTGKTVVLMDKLLKGMPPEYVPNFLMFSAKTSANQTQDLIDGKLDKRRKGVFAPPLGKYAVFFIDDLNMPSLETYGAQPPIELLRQWMDHTLEDYNQVNTAQMKLVLFLDAVQHVCRISRVIRQPLGNALLLGVGGSGRQSLSRLATHIVDFTPKSVELTPKKCRFYTQKGRFYTKNVDFTPKKCRFYTQKDLNNILNSGDVPNIYAFDDLDNIYNAMKPIVMDQGLPPTKSNLYNAFTKRIRANLHTICCMSPIGEIFRARLRMFPSLITCCTIDWFSEWPDEALQSVAHTFLGDITDIDTSNQKLMNGMVNMCVIMHQSVATHSKRFLSELSRHNYVTPTSYLELLGIFNKLIGLKISELTTNRDRMKIGLDKV